MVSFDRPAVLLTLNRRCLFCILCFTGFTSSVRLTGSYTDR